LTEKVDDPLIIMVPTKSGWIGLVWFCQLKTNPATLSLFNYHRGTDPRLVVKRKLLW